MSFLVRAGKPVVRSFTEAKIEVWAAASQAWRLMRTGEPVWQTSLPSRELRRRAGLLNVRRSLCQRACAPWPLRSRERAHHPINDVAPRFIALRSLFLRRMVNFR